jgi:antitoxin FitA
MLPFLATIEKTTMSAVTVRKLPEATHRALKLRAVQNGHSTEAEIRNILEAAVRPDSRVKMGTALAALAQRIGGEVGKVEFELKREPTPIEAARFD